MRVRQTRPNIKSMLRTRTIIMAIQNNLMTRLIGMVWIMTLVCGLSGLSRAEDTQSAAVTNAAEPGRVTLNLKQVSFEEAVKALFSRVNIPYRLSPDVQGFNM